MDDEKNAKTITEWMNVFDELYYKADDERTPEQLWIAIMAHSSSIGESIRRIHYPDLMHGAAHTFCWLCSFINKLKKVNNDIFSFTESLSGIVSLKYPGKCGHCESSPCKCQPPEIDEKVDKSARYKKLFEIRKGMIDSAENYDIALWQFEFEQIYKNQIHILTLENIGLHFLEEVGEGAIAIRKLSQLKNIMKEELEGIKSDLFNELTTVDGIVKNYEKCCLSKKAVIEKGTRKIDYNTKEEDMLKWRIVEAKMSLVIEIADTFSWFCAILNKLQNIYKNCGMVPLSLENELNKEYYDIKNNTFRCPTCKTKPCSCIFFS